MEPMHIVILIAALAALVAAVGNIVIPALKRRGMDVFDALSIAESMTKGAEIASETVKSLLQQLGGAVDDGIAEITDRIINYAKTGVEMAEQLYYIHEVGPDERNPAALEFVYDALDVAGIERTAAVERLVEGAVEAAVGALGHGGGFAKFEISLDACVSDTGTEASPTSGE